MKKLLKFLTYWYSYCINYRKITFFKKVNTKLSKTVTDREVERIILKGKIVKMTRKYLRIDANSHYISKDYKSNIEISKRIYAEFGDEMQKLNIRLTKNLKFA